MKTDQRDLLCASHALAHAPVLALAVPVRAEAMAPPPRSRPRAGRQRRALGDHFGIANFGVNLTRLAPGAMTARRHAHSRQDEFVFVLQGTLTLVDESGRTTLTRGMCVGFPAGQGNAHHFVNESNVDAIVLEVGDRSPGDRVRYPDDDVAALSIDGA